jgi:hypothetical protein
MHDTDSPERPRDRKFNAGHASPRPSVLNHENAHKQQPAAFAILARTTTASCRIWSHAQGEYPQAATSVCRRNPQQLLAHSKLALPQP